MNAVKIAVLNGGKVSQVLELEPGRAPHNVTVRATKGSRFVVLGSDGEPTPQPIQTRRIGNNLLVDLDPEGEGLPTLIIEDFHAVQAELIGKDDEGTYHAYVQQGDADLDAADLEDGGDTELVLAAGQIADGGALAEALSGAGAAAGLSGWALAGLAGLGAAGIGAVVTRSGNKNSSNTSETPTTGAPGPDKATVLVGVHDDVGTQQGLINAGDITDDTTPTFNGTGTPGNTIEILDGGTLIGTAVVQADGQWSWTPVTPLAEGAHSMAFREVDGAGNASPDSPGFDFIVDITAPGKGQVGGVHQGVVWDDSGAQQGAIPDGGRTDDDRPELRGTAEPGATIEIYDNGVRLGAVTAGADGQWSFTPIMALSVGQHAFTVVVVDGAGGSSPPSDPWTIVVGEDRPQVGGVWDDSTGVLKPVLPGQPIKDGTPLIGGGGANPGDTIVVIQDGEEVGQVIVDDEGNWTWTPDSDLPDGEHRFEFVIEDAQGNRSGASEPVAIIVDTTPPASPGFSLGNIWDGSDGTLKPIGADGLTKNATPVFTGTEQQPGDKVILRDKNTGATIGEAIVGADGAWEIIPGTALLEGEYTLELVIEDTAGNQSAPSDPISVTVDVTPPATPDFDIGDIWDVSDGTLKAIGTDGLTKDTMPVVTGDGQQQGDKVILRDKNTGVSIGETIVGADGTWKIIPGTALAQGEHTFELVIEDKAGNQSTPSDPVQIIVGVAAPVTPAIGIGDIWDDTSGTRQLVGSSGKTKDTTPVFTGNGQESGDKVILRDSKTGVTIGDAIVAADGTWEIIPGTALARGEHTFELVIEDTAGNQSAPSAPVTVIVYSSALNTTVSIDEMTKDSGIKDDFRTNDGSAGRTVSGGIIGLLADGECVMVSCDGGKTWQPAQISNDRWSVVDDSHHSESWEIQARVVDASGNAGDVASQVVTLDVLPPNAPTSVSWDGATIVVEFDAQEGGAPRAMEIVIDGVSTTFILTPEQLSAGRVDVPWSSVENGNIGVVTARVTDESGNTSGYHEMRQTHHETARANFDDQSARCLDRGEVVRFDGLDMKVNFSGHTKPSAFETKPEGGFHGKDSMDMALSLGHRLDIRLELHKAANTFSFNYGDLDAKESFELSFYDSNGNEIHRRTFSGDAGDAREGGVTISIPYGHGSFSTVKMTSSLAYLNDPVWIDDIVVSAVEYVDTAGSSVLDDAHQVNDVTGQDGGDDSHSMQLNAADPVLDRSMIESPSSSSAIVELTSNGDSAMKLSLADVLTQGGKDLFIADGSTQLMIKGDAGDSVELSDLVDGLDNGDWAQQSGTVTVEGAQYAVYTHSGSNAELLVQSGVQVHLDNH